MNTPNAYALAGVDTSVEAKASRIMYEASKATFANRSGKIGEIFVPFDDFSGIKVIMIESLPKGSCMSLGLDGAGSKVEFAQREGRYGSIAFDLFAMLCDDAVVRGAEPVLVGNVLDVKSLGTDERYLPIVRELAGGTIAAAQAANVAVVNGEIAQMTVCMGGYGDFPFNWGGACVWYGKLDRLLTGGDIRPGLRIVGLRETTPRANGISLFRRTFKQAYGEEWHTQPFLDGTLGSHVLAPSTIYCRLITHLHGGFDGEPVCRLNGVAHVTGGGIPEKLGRVLRPSGLGATLNDLWQPPAIMHHCQMVGNIDDRDAYESLHMGPGMLLLTSEPETVIHEAAIFGFEAKDVGEITTDPGISLISKGYKSPGMKLTW